jgi:nitrate/TMAO reductase-like tetraheme cytochrome c subunit
MLVNTPPVSRLAAAALLAALVTTGACGGSSGGPTFANLTDPAACKSCHPTHYEEWSGSMHAYAADDPVFRAMNSRAQRENPATGTFCVNCHAPVAVREGLTTDGLNLDQVPQEKRGVTCYFCHSAEKVDGTHNNPLVLADDGTLFGPFSDPASGTPHKAKYSPLFDGATAQSASACGSCHDIQNLQGAHVERTFEEWQGTLFAAMPGGQSCADCHMPGRDGTASTVSSKVRRLHSHLFPGVDLAVGDFPTDSPQNAAQQAATQAFLDTVVQGTICLNQLAGRIELTLDNVGAGHGWPSGATPDRRGWIELTAYAGDQVIYESGGTAALPLEASPDPDLWLLRDCLFDAAGNELTMFWQPTTVTGNGLPGPVVQNVSDPTSFSRTHLKQIYPSGDGTLAQVPTRITARVHLQAVGDDVLRDLVTSGDLDPSVPAQIARYQLGGGAVLEWTAATAGPFVDPGSGATLSCTTTGNVRTTTVPAVSHARCAASGS